MDEDLDFFGNHRGGRGIVDYLPPDTAKLYGSTWPLADPQKGRSLELATRVRDKFPWVNPQPLVMTGQEALKCSGEKDTLVIAADTVDDTREILEARGELQGAVFQLLARSPGGSSGTHTAFEGTLAPGDQDTQKKATLLLSTLESMSQEASSRVLTGGTDPLAALTLAPSRNLVSRQTVRHLKEKDRNPSDMSGGTLTMVLGPHVYPLVPVQGRPDDRHNHHRDLALEVAGMIPERHLLNRGLLGRFSISAVVVPEEETIYFMTVARSRTGKRRVDGLIVFAPPVSIPADFWEVDARPSPYVDSVVFTD